MKIPKTFRGRLLIASSSWIVYLLLFTALYPYATGTTLATLNVIPAVIFGLLLGPQGGLIFAAIALPVNLLLFNGVGTFTNNGLAFHLGGLAGATLTSVGAGVIHLYQRIREQAEELQKERQLLQAEIERRVQAEIELQARNKELDAFAKLITQTQ